jgi:probable HAF family extracellular repeat protein
MSTDRRKLMMAVGVLLSGCGDTTQPTPASESPVLVPGKNVGTGITITNLGLGRAEDIDDAGRIVGSLGPFSGPLRAFLWTPTSARATTGSFSDLGDLGGGTAQARGINASLQVVGSSTEATGRQDPFFWEAGTMHDLGIPVGTDFGEAMDVNDGGTRRVVGGVASPTDQAFVWTVSGTGAAFSAALEVLPGLSTSGRFAFALNDASVVVGYSNDAVGTNQPAVWRNPPTWSVSALSLLTNASGGVAYDINSAGSIVGFNRFTPGACNSRAVVWVSADDPATELPMLSGGSCAEARAINDAGQISGFARDGHFRGRAVLWQPSGSGGYSVTDLGLKAGTLGQVLGMNEPLGPGTGVEVVGYAQSPNRDRAILWTLP